MGRIAIAIMVGGGALAYFGYEEFRVGAGASATPVHVELASLESGTPPPDNHLEIGPHWAIFPVWVGWGDQDSDKLDYIYYPIVSETHPYNQAWDSLLARYGEQEIPESEIPQLSSLAILVKSKRYPTESAIPIQWENVESIEGLLVHDIESLKSGEEKALHESFPGLSLSDIMILEQDRRPKSTLVALAMMGGGVVLILLGGGVLVGAFRE